MAGYKPLRIAGNSTGLVQEREEFLLPDDAYPILQNAYVWREKILRKKGYSLLGRLNRVKTSSFNLSKGSAGNITFTLSFSGDALASVVPQTLVLVVGAPTNQTLTDVLGTGTLTVSGAGVITAGTLNYSTGVVVVTVSALLAVSASTVTFNYYPNLPVMGIRIRELANSANDETLFFDQKYAYFYSSFLASFTEFLPGTTWNANGSAVSATDFFWSTNYWISDTTNFGSTGSKLFWTTNNTGSYLANADPIRITDGTLWLNFSPPTYGQIDATTFLLQCLSFLPFRGRLVCFNTWEGTGYANMQNFSNRIRWSTIGNPFLPYAAGPPATGSWRDDIRGQGGFLDIPTSEDITAVGFVRDNLVIYCERSTWQLRYTGRSIAPFQIERVNSELGTESPYSAVQFDTSLVGIGDKGIVQCDSYKSNRIDIKIPDFIDQFTSENNGVFRVQGIRDFPNRLAYWTIPLSAGYDPVIGPTNDIFPNTRLVYNYENDSWALFNDSLTALGLFEPSNGRTWLNTPEPWLNCPFPWIENTEGIQQIVGGNQQGFIEYLDVLTVNDASLFISNITAGGTNPTQISSPNHNLSTEFVIEIDSVLGSAEYTALNGGIFGVIVVDANTITLTTYDAASDQFSAGVITQPGTYIGSGLIKIRENFSIQSKKFNFLDEGQNIQLGYIDILMASSESPESGAISLNVYLDYNKSQVSNTLPENAINNGLLPTIPDTFFNSVIPTISASANGIGGVKFWQRVYCATRASFLTLEYTFSNLQMSGIEQQLPVQIDAQVLWIRKGGRLTQPL